MSRHKINLAVHIGDKVRRFRKRANLSQEELANAADIDRSYVGRIERGQVSLTVEKLYQIAVAVDCRPELFLPDMDITEVHRE